MLIKKVYGLEICVFVAPLRGATSGLSLSAVFTLFLAIFVDQCTLFALYNNKKMILMKNDSKGLRSALNPVGRASSKQGELQSYESLGAGGESFRASRVGLQAS